MEIYMKKSLIAFAALTAIAGVAQAQSSSVTLFGVMDAGIATVNNVGATGKSVTFMNNGGLATPRWGIRGTEDLGGGASASFWLESELLTSNGGNASATDALFNRGAWVSLGNASGTVTLGRINTFQYAAGAAFDPLGGGNFGGSIASGKYGFARIKNAISLESTPINGLTFGVQTGIRTESFALNTAPTATGTYGEAAGNTGANRHYQGKVGFASGAFSAVATYGQQNDNSGNRINSVAAIVGKYNLEGSHVLYAGAYVNNLSLYCASTGCQDGTTFAAATSNRETVSYLGATYAINPALRLNGMVQFQQLNLTNGTTRNPQLYMANLIYDLSKRTALYAAANYVAGTEAYRSISMQD